MKIFLINLVQDVDRLAAADRQLKKLGVNYERFAAVYAKAMPKAVKMKHVSRFRWWCSMGRSPRDGEIGCALSHQAIYEKIIKENITWACILEDDVVLDPRFKSVLAYIEQNGDKDNPSVYLLSNHADPNGQGGNDFTGFTSPADSKYEFRRTYWDLFTEGYVINRQGASALLRANHPMITPCDQWMRWAGLDIIHLYHAMPTTCGQNKAGFASSTGEGFVAVASMSPLRKFIHKGQHAFGLCIDRLLMKITKR